MKTATKPIGTEFPKIRFWDKKAPLISLVNPGDFKQTELVEKLGLDRLSKSFLNSFGTRDREEVLRRQRTAKFLMENPRFRNFLSCNTEAVASHARFSASGQEFLNDLWVDPKTGHNWFHGKMHELIGLFGDGVLPTEIADFRQFLTETIARVEAMEGTLAKEMGVELERGTFFHGTIRLSFNGYYKDSYHGKDAWEVVDSRVFGYQKASYHLAGMCGAVHRPNWLKKGIVRGLGINLLAEFLLKPIDHWREQNRYHDLLITKMPKELTEALVDFAKNTFTSGLKNALDSLDMAEVNLYFRYQENKLVVRVVDFQSRLRSPQYSGESKEEMAKREKELRSSSPVIGSDYLGYSKAELRKIVAQNKGLAETTARRERQTTFSLGFLSFLWDKFPELLGEGIAVNENYDAIRQRFGWSSVEGLRQTWQFADRCQYTEQYRAFVASRIAELKEIAEAVECLMKKSREWKLPLQFPTILQHSEHVVSFNELFPVHLIGRGVEDEKITSAGLVPITALAPLNGRMIGLTGQNAGGKTAIEEAILDAIWIIQSGLPWFCQNMALNVKSTLGMVFLERGEGSTLELMLKKTGRVLEAVQKSSENGIVVFLDEVGTGTQESSGLILGERILSTLANSGCSVVFSTQITSLAEKAESDMNALCFQVSMDHRIQSGIGTGGADALAEKLGVNKFLVPIGN